MMAPATTTDYTPTSSPNPQPAKHPIYIRGVSRGVQKLRRSTSTGGGRAWTEEEEEYLLRTRMHKMPYKHIASHLRKTELACRLHYHQMSYGNNRRRRAESQASSVSLDSSFAPVEESAREYQSMPPYSSPSSPPRLESAGDSPLSNVSYTPATYQSRAHIPILPKPISSHGRSLPPPNSTSDPEWNRPLHASAPPPATSAPHEHSRTYNYHSSNSKLNPDQPIDNTKLRALYDTHRDSFWSFMSSEYSHGPAVPAHKLEAAFLETVRVSYPSRSSSRAPGPAGPATPAPSPPGSSSAAHEKPLGQPAYLLTPPRSGFRAVNEHYNLSSASASTSSGEEKKISSSSSTSTSTSSRNTPSPIQKCAVSSLLTVEREVWAPKEISSA